MTPPNTQNSTQNSTETSSEKSADSTDAYAQLLRADWRFIDVRAEVEFDKGSLPGAVNQPILNNEERHRIGICYKSNGPDAATALGHKIVSGELRQQRIDQWQKIAAAANEQCVIMCWRGGQRSQIAQQWLADAGVQIPRVHGGFKALRAFCIDQLSKFAATETPWLMIGGRTGSGKTVVLNQVAGSIDLEGHAHHRGSAFGGYPDGQPTPISFENALAQDSLRHSHTLVVLEDEGATIGRLGLPREWHERMQRSPVALLEVDQPIRVEHIFAEYVGRDTKSELLRNQYLDALRRIRKRLGGARSSELQSLVSDAFATGSQDAHRAWIKGLLDSYYDPMYDYQLEKKLARIKFRGDTAAVIEFAAQFTSPSN